MRASPRLIGLLLGLAAGVLLCTDISGAQEALPMDTRAVSEAAGDAETEAERERRERLVREDAVLESVGALAVRFAAEGYTLRGVRGLVDLSHAAYERGDLEQAAAFAQLAIEEADESSGGPPMDAAYNRAVALRGAGATSEAERLLRLVAAMPAGNSRERRIAAGASQHLGLIQLAFADENAELELGKADPFARILEPDPELGWEDYADAVEFVIAGYIAAARHFERANELDPEDRVAKRNLQIARLRAGELVRQRYNARREFEALLAAIVRPEELIRETMRLADEQGAAAADTRRRERRLRGASEAVFEDIAALSEQAQVPINGDTGGLFQRAGTTRELLQTRLTVSDPMLASILADLIEEFELGLRDAVESQRWSVFEFGELDVTEGRELQQQAERDLREVLERLQQNAQDFQNQAQEQQQRSEQQSDEQREAREERGAEHDNQQRSYEGERAEQEREARMRQLLEREQEDLEATRQSRRERARPVERDW